VLSGKNQMILIDGKRVSEELLAEMKAETDKIRSAGGKVPHLAAILVGNDGGSETYVNGKVKACEKAGFDSTLLRLPDNISENELLHKIQELNNDDSIDGFIVQLPLPKHLAASKFIEAIDPKKDVDGFHPANIGRMVLGLPTYIPATPFGILKLLERYKIETAGKHCVVVGRSHIVGLPISILLGRDSYPGNCTVTLAHSKTEHLGELTRTADILVVALGKSGFITGEMVKQGAVVIDVGITRVSSNSTKSGFQLLGDVNFEEVAPKCSYITPVPGGIGPMTIASLMINTLRASRKEVYPS
jgi:methylenetetrahydrofolate dehydrogenase (NADP+)/methenyltetrahydrofolate cyclohydrolase